LCNTFKYEEEIEVLYTKLKGRWSPSRNQLMHLLHACRSMQHDASEWIKSLNATHEGEVLIKLKSKKDCELNIIICDEETI